MIVPAPPQVRQVLLREKKPWLSEVTPRPLQSGQIVGDVPGAAPLPLQLPQAFALTTGTLTVAPCRASSKDTRTDTSTSAPRIDRGCWPRPRVNRPPNRSPRSKPSVALRISKPSNPA